MMRKYAPIRAIMVFGFVLILTAGHFAMPPERRGAGAKLFDPATVETISGEVLEVKRILKKKRRGHGIHLLVKTSGETISVHVGPSWYLEEQKIDFQKSDQVVITGSRVTFEGKPAIIASEIKKGDMVLVLRDQNGIPLWSRGRPSRP